MNHEYLIEKRLQMLDPQLHSQYRNCIVVSNQMLQQYQSTFPEYTDHSTLHTMEIVDCCNALIREQVSLLSADDLYVLLMGAVFHDVGMGISERDFYAFFEESASAETGHFSREDLQEAIRKNHHEISGWFLKKYWALFDIPNEAYASAIIQVCRGHRKVNLFDPTEYPERFPVGEGRSVALPYLAAVVRLADELDIAADRNPAFLYDPKQIKNDISRLEFLKHQGIRSVEIQTDQVLITALSEDPAVCAGIAETAAKLAAVLDECRRVVSERTAFTIHQTHIALHINAEQMLF